MTLMGFAQLLTAAIVSKRAIDELGLCVLTQDHGTSSILRKHGSKDRFTYLLYLQYQNGTF